ncbi:MAG: fumarylacetoacetate hydrolase family protein [Treponema sp.]|nr:fumarylacetoacetate hydrolase family protein [Treponema sp.]
MDAAKIPVFAEKLFNAERNRKAIGPLTEQDISISLDDAYYIQLENIKRVVDMGYIISGKKIGLTSPGIQSQFGVNEPDYGHLFAAMECKDGKIRTDALLQPKIEGEIAFILKGDLTGGKLRRDDVIANTDYVVAAFEIVDSRVADWQIKLPDTVADNASSGRYVLGTKKIKLNEIDLPAETMKLYKNGELVGEGTGAAVLGDPCIAVAWLANRLWDFNVALKAGEIILSGAFSAAPAAAKGDTFTAQFSSFGKVEAEFV